jgi:hypothetical protein
MKEGILILQEVCQSSTHATVVALEYKIILDLEKISSRFVPSLLRISTIRASEVIQICLLASKENKARGYKLDVFYIKKRTHLGWAY